jgi:hypothetical protein
MKVLYKPFALIAALIGAKLGENAFKALWAKLDDAEPPLPTTENASLPKVVGAQALHAATVAGATAAANRASARTFHYLTGFWPGDKREKAPQD